MLRKLPEVPLKNCAGGARSGMDETPGWKKDDPFPKQLVTPTPTAQRLRTTFHATVLSGTRNRISISHGGG